MTSTPIRGVGVERLPRQHPMLISLVAVTVAGLVPVLVACDGTSGAAPRTDAGHGMVRVYKQVQKVRDVSYINPDSPANRVNFIEEAYRPTGLSGDISVGIRTDWQVHLVNVKTREGHRLTGGVDRKGEAVISDSHVAWRSQSRLREVLSNAPLVRRSYHIFVMDIESSATRRITSGTAMRRNLQVDGSRLVWEESRTKVGDRYAGYDVYAYDIDLDEILPVAVGPGSQRFPAIHGDRVVWVDDRDCAETKNGSMSTRSCPGGLLDVYLYDFATGKERPVAKSTASDYHAPDIHGDHVVWRAHDGRFYSENTTLHLHSLADGRTHTIVSLEHGNIGRPMVSDEYVSWTVRDPCDVVWIPPRDTETGAFVYSIADGTSRQLSEFAEPDILLDGKTAVVHEGCWFPGPVYSIILD